MFWLVPLAGPSDSFFSLSLGFYCLALELLEPVPYLHGQRQSERSAHRIQPFRALVGGDGIVAGGSFDKQTDTHLAR